MKREEQVIAVGRCGTPDAVAGIELRLREVDGCAPSPLLSLENMRRAVDRPRPVLASPRPYVSNLCVSKRCRRRGVAKALLSAAEFLSGPDVWGYDSLFIHVQKENEAALDLYTQAGYKPITCTDDDVPLIYLYKPLRPDAPTLDMLQQALLEQDSTDKKTRRRRLQQEPMNEESRLAEIKNEN